VTESYFHRRGESFEARDIAAGPWSPDMLHGRLLGGLAARALEAEFVGPGMRVARLTVDLFRPAGFEEISVATSEVRRGRRITVADAVVTVGEHAVASARAVVLAEGDPPPGVIWAAPVWESPHPSTLPPPPARADDLVETEPLWQFRIHEAGFESAGQARIWTNETGRLVDDEPVTPFVRAALSSDLASPLANGGDVGVGYINGDYTLAIARYPTSDWVGLEAAAHLAADGIAVGACTLYDLDGPFATSTTTALANPILEGG